MPINMTQYIMQFSILKKKKHTHTHTHIYIYYDQITTLFLMSFYFVYKITKDYIFFTRKVIEGEGS